MYLFESGQRTLLGIVEFDTGAAVDLSLDKNGLCTSDSHCVVEIVQVVQ
jgi:hypothetical protein